MVLTVACEGGKGLALVDGASEVGSVPELSLSGALSVLSGVVTLSKLSVVSGVLVVVSGVLPLSKLSVVSGGGSSCCCGSSDSRFKNS